MFKIQNKFFFENLNFEFGICLEFRILNLGFPRAKREADSTRRIRSC